MNLAKQLQGPALAGSNRTLQGNLLSPGHVCSRPAWVGRQHQASMCVRVVPEQKQEGIDPAASSARQEQELSQPSSILERAKIVLDTLSKYRRSITVVAAVLDVAFIWVCIKGARSLGWWE
ncbi:hypothetical protein DUNSADRAFT_11031 [Dunaliella salina]|uniref:Uncharacterized protein n=1 Tax=Dunaliella salina TaxID=3046 RepID=A0ABQ7GE89_DUNSA|nr:hypothetical protein DUNSADRAFT_11031 [Dunaliella salina]|eukprot:KAF5832919.1 hypothetical protein DUNSADRAFT_11031 [Dunaliella salina]